MELCRTTLSVQRATRRVHSSWLWQWATESHSCSTHRGAERDCESRRERWRRHVAADCVGERGSGRRLRERRTRCSQIDRARHLGVLAPHALLRKHVVPSPPRSPHLVCSAQNLRPDPLSTNNSRLHPLYLSLPLFVVGPRLITSCPLLPRSSPPHRQPASRVAALRRPAGSC